MQEHVEVKIVDFGIFGSTSGINPEKINAGSLRYMPPEVLLGHTESSAAIDVWGLGIILHGLLVGHLPFNIKNKVELRKMILTSEVRLDTEMGLSEEAKDLVLRMLDKNPEKRITIREIIDHGWLSRYKEMKIRKKWGFLPESDDEEI